MKTQSDDSPLGCVKYLFVIAIGAMVFAIMVGIAVSVDETPPAASAPTPRQEAKPAAPAPEASRYGRDDGMAWVMCQDFLEARLTAPSTAKYPWSYRERVQYLGDSRYRVRSHFDAQNGFGAMVRGNFDCKIRQTSRTEWTLEDLVIQ